MKKGLILFFVFVIFAKVHPESIRLWNDSPYELTVVIKAADGTFLGKKVMPPGMQVQSFELSMPATPVTSLTPYNITWNCPYGGQYSFSSEGSAGGLVTASGCSGQHYCQPKPKKKDQNTDEEDEKTSLLEEDNQIKTSKSVLK